MQEVAVDNCEENIDLSGSFEIYGSTLAVKYGGTESYDLEIVELKAGSLILLTEDDHDGDGDMEEIRARYTR